MRIHFIAIGGSIMHNLAISLERQGHQVSGSDDQIVEPSRSHLIDAGLLPEQLGWFEEKITDDIDAVILGAHALVNNPELLKAQELDLKIYSFPEFIQELSQDKTRVVIAGSYGKTTIMSMIMHVLKTFERPFDYLVGAQLEGFDNLIEITKTNKIILIEGDENVASSLSSKSKFMFYKPNIALISGINWNEYSTTITFDNYLKQFEDFINTIESKGTLIYNKEDKYIQKIINDTKSCKINRHGYQIPEYTINKGTTFIKATKGDIPLQVFGKYNLSNIAGAYTVCEWLGIKKDDFFEAIKTFKSSIRYLEFVASFEGSVVYQDFDHTPKKLKASIHAIKEQFPSQKLVAIIELNAYDSLDEKFVNQYKDTMNEADLPVVFVNMESIKEVNKCTTHLLEDIRIAFNRSDLDIVTNIKDLYEFLENFKSKGNNLLLMSSGNYSGVNLTELADHFFKNY
ncbi:peptidoglycan synthetase [Sphingobacterium sp. ML3W]|uniref:Mur ligase family protein n=1 Tax=Sphingobacterium sp. ML3W TaxID=1538644 RepID=UPI0004F90B59|nr:Mur ligase family protein [Sphingobacterium sp. ML3W]AIM36272.1 peptidoglycan synthetase [Sphingobacterium sp. ML3W]